MTNVLVLPGSVRKGSYNLALALAAIECAPAGSAFTLTSIRDIPLYDGDVEAASGVPAAAAKLKDALAAADGLLLVTPEYNNSVPGTLKNAFDWMSRPTRDIARVFKGRAVGVIGATPGMGGTRLSQNAWLPVFRTLGMQLWTGGSVFVAEAGKMFDASGALADGKVREVLKKYVEGFAAFAARSKVQP
jgi:NAD(P)H-dependent FMN reductase